MTKFSQAPHKCLKIEDMKVCTPYAISLNPEIQFVGYDRKTKSNTYTSPNMAMSQYITLHLTHCKYSTYELYFELSPIGRQHYHGIIQISDIEQFYTKDIHILKTLGTFDISHLFCKKDRNGEESEGGDPERVDLSPEDSWLAYCTKQQSILKNKYNVNTNVSKKKVV